MLYSWVQFDLEKITAGFGEDVYKYKYEDNDWVTDLISGIGIASEFDLSFDIVSPNQKTTRCINMITQRLMQKNKSERITAISFHVEKKEEISTEYCDAVLALIKQVTNVREVGIQANSNFSDIYKYIILGSKIRSLKIMERSLVVDNNIMRGFASISDVFKLIGKGKKYDDIDDSIKYALKGRRTTTLSLPDITYKKPSCIDTISCNITGAWDGLKLIFDNYPLIEEFRTSKWEFVEKLSTGQTSCPNLRKIIIYSLFFSLDNAETIVKWSRLNKLMKTISFYYIDPDPGALKYLLDDINSPPGNRTHIEDFLVKRYHDTLEFTKQVNTIKQILKDRKEAFELALIGNRLKFQPTQNYSLILSLLGLELKKE